MVRNALSRKLIRDIWKNRMQFLAVILLCALGTWLFSGLDAAWRMIDLSANIYFEEQNLADLWVTLQPVDRQTLKAIELTDGVERLQARATVNMDTDLDNDSSLMVTAVDRPSEINIPLMYEGEPLADNDLRGCLLDDAFEDALLVGMVDITHDDRNTLTILHNVNTGAVAPAPRLIKIDTLIIPDCSSKNKR